MTFLKFLESADAVPLIFAEFLLVFSSMFEFVAQRTMEIASSDLTGGATQATILRYTSDQVWRVSLLNSIVFALISIAAFIDKMPEIKIVTIWMPAIVASIIIVTMYCLLKYPRPADLEEKLPYLGVSRYNVSNIVLFLLNLLVLVVGYFATAASENVASPSCQHAALSSLWVG